MGAENVEVPALLTALRSPEVRATNLALATVERCLALYDELDVLSADRALPLDTSCHRCAECWSPLSAAERPRGESGGISVPFVGDHYDRFRTVVLAINMHNYGGLGANWWISRGHIQDLADGKRPNFSYAVGSILHALHLSQLGRDPMDDPPDPRLAATAWTEAAFAETVKCSPSRPSSTPTDAMLNNCPPLFVKRELEILRPRTVVVMGRSQAALRVANALQAKIEDRRPGLERYRTSVAGRDVAMFACNHPSYGGWRASWPSLIESLRAFPLQALPADED